MQFSCDRTGFPLIAIPAARVAVHLLPVTKVQFEYFLAEPNPYGDTWYEEVLALNPRIAYCHCTAETQEQLFLTGILPEETLAFARWMGEGFDLPTVAEWRSIYTTLAAQASLSRHGLSRLETEPVRVILQQLLTQRPCHSLLDLSVMCGGVVEWVRQSNTWLGLGAPRPEFHANLWDPLVDEVKPVRWGERVRFFGFRLVQRVK